MAMTKKPGKIAFEILAILISVITIVPLYLVLINSFKNQAEAADLLITFPAKWNMLENYAKVFIESKIPMAFFNSLVLTLASTALLVVFGPLTSFVIQRRNGRFSNFIKSFFMLGLILPFSVVTTYIFLNYLHMSSTYVGVILLFVATQLPFTIYVYTDFFNNLPREIDESAVMDGCSGLKLFFSIIYPLLKPVTVTIMIIMFVTIWNNFGIVIYFFNTASRYTLTLTVYFFYGMYSSSWNLVFADLMMVSMPAMVLYLFLQKYIVAGMTAGAVKG